MQDLICVFRFCSVPSVVEKPFYHRRHRTKTQKNHFLDSLNYFSKNVGSA